ncbi:DUF4166 domain-containing protein [Lysobacter tyrosinilyticus]
MTRWFGEDFARLHPALQALHREGGTLSGAVTITTGRGFAGALGRRMARRLGIPTVPGLAGFEVRITHDAQAMRWERRFGEGRTLLSVFRPLGMCPHGYWLEDTGVVQLKLTVDIRDGGWYWRLLGASLRGVPLPLWLFPRTEAFKRIDADGGYRFAVAFALFPFGTLLKYEGVLTPERAAQAAPR